MDPSFMNLSLNSDLRSQSERFLLRSAQSYADEFDDGCPPFPDWPPVGDLTVTDLLEMIRNQSPGKIPLPGVSGRVSGYDYANTTAWKLNVTQVGRHDAKGFKRYCPGPKGYGRSEVHSLHRAVDPLVEARRTPW
ncbi:hypothetical protein V5799_015971 [Amblyomma americanum]|uniref:Uncharacterized protein n=1 Tax=Amblyomma americanum TaxID=6943 RepID=A0AAQ4F6B4_AMBAM